MASQYAKEFVDQHSIDCPWRTSWCPQKLQHYQLQNTNEEFSILMQRAAQLETIEQVDFQRPKELISIPSPVVLAICGWQCNANNHVDCMFGCSTNVSIDDQFHPLFEHRWCCPVVNLTSLRSELTGWQAMLHLYLNKRAIVA